MISHGVKPYRIDSIEVTAAYYIGDYAIRILFSNGNEKLVDFKPFLTKSLHLSISKYLDETLFKQFEIRNSNLNWNDYNLIFRFMVCMQALLNKHILTNILAECLKGYNIQLTS